MKIRPEHYIYMKNAIASLDVNEIRLAILNSDKQPKDFNRRLIWDCAYAAGLSRWLCDNVYPYADDTHIDTALRKISKELNIAA